MKVIKIEAIEELLAIKGGTGETKDQESTTINVQCTHENSGVFVKP